MSHEAILERCDLFKLPASLFCGHTDLSQVWEAMEDLKMWTPTVRFGLSSVSATKPCVRCELRLYPCSLICKLQVTRTPSWPGLRGSGSKSSVQGSCSVLRKTRYPLLRVLPIVHKCLFFCGSHKELELLSCLTEYESLVVDTLDLDP